LAGISAGKATERDLNKTAADVVAKAPPQVAAPIYNWAGFSRDSDSIYDLRDQAPKKRTLLATALFSNMTEIRHIAS